MRAQTFSPAELEELRRIDAELDLLPVSQSEREESDRRDYLFRGLTMSSREKAQRAYYEANREKIAEAQRAYYEANREKIAEIGAALRRWRMDRSMTQADFGSRIGLTQRAVSYWERGEVPVDFKRLEDLWPSALEAFGPMELGGVG